MLQHFMYYRMSADRSVEEAANQIGIGNLAFVCVLGEGVSILANAFMTDIFVCCNLLMVIIILFILEWELL